jgi:hypothetical protein
MSANDSNLSDPRYGYDLVVAVTQASVNATMKEFLSKGETPEVAVCYVYADDNHLVAIDYEQLKANAKGSDPFKVTQGAKPKVDQDLINLEAANFAGGFKAAIGLPDLPLSSLPPIVTLKKFGAPVLFNLLCREFHIVGFEYGPRGSATWIDQSQPSGSGEPWYFSSNVDLNVVGAHPDDPALTPEVRDRAAELDRAGKAGQFSIQKLLLDLDTAFLQTIPVIKGIAPDWPVWILISRVFLSAYMEELKKSGKPVFGFTFEMTRPDPGTVQLGALAYEASALLDGSGQPIPSPTAEEENAATLDYLGSTSTSRPTPVEFSWNWVELGEMSSLSGVQAVRRDHFVDFLAGELNGGMPALSFEPKMELSHSGENLYISYGVGRAVPSASGSFKPVAIGAPDKEGFTEVLNLRYAHESSDNSETSLHDVEIWGSFKYFLNGSIAFKGNEIRLVFHPQVWMDFSHREVVVNYTDLSGHFYYDKTRTVVWQLGVDQHGRLRVTPLPEKPIVDESASWNFDPGGILGKLTSELDEVGKGFETIEKWLGESIDFQLGGYLDEVNRLLDSAEGWVFPGADSFLFQQPKFARSMDLVADVTYSSPEMNEWVEAFAAEPGQ